MCAYGAHAQRPVGVTVQYDTISGESRKMRIDGFNARVFQHEFDHLQVRWLAARFPHRKHDWASALPYAP